jgi:hypothetical protein
VGWVHGSLVEPAIEDEPGAGGEDVAALLELGRGHRQRGGSGHPGRVRAEDAKRERAANRWWRRKR